MPEAAVSEYREEAKKLALRVKTLEAQLRQSVPRKEHNEITSKLEREIASLEKDLDRAKADFAKTIAINRQIDGVEGQIGSVIKATSGVAKTLERLDSIESGNSANGKAIAAQSKAIENFIAKISQGMVPSSIHWETINKVRTLEAKCDDLNRRLEATVPSLEYVALGYKFEELTKRVGSMVPSSDLAAANQRIGELEASVASMVPREQLTASDGRIAELEAKVAQRVPQTVYDDLVARVVSLAEAVTGGEIQQAETSDMTAEVVETEVPAVEIESESTDFSGIEATPEPVVADVTAVETVVAGASEPIQAVAEAPEIREVQSQLAELNTQTIEAQPIEVPATTTETAPEAATAPAAPASTPTTATTETPVVATNSS